MRPLHDALYRIQHRPVVHAHILREGFDFSQQIDGLDLRILEMLRTLDRILVGGLELCLGEAHRLSYFIEQGSRLLRVAGGIGLTAGFERPFSQFERGPGALLRIRLGAHLRQVRGKRDAAQQDRKEESHFLLSSFVMIRTRCRAWNSSSGYLPSDVAKNF